MTITRQMLDTTYVCWFRNKRNTEKAKQEILKKSKTFGGTYSDKDLMKVIGIARNSYYKYKRELQQEQEQKLA